MSYGGAGMDVGMTGMSGTTEGVSTQGSGEMPKSGTSMPSMGGGGGGKGAHQLPSQRPIGEHPETPEGAVEDLSPVQEGFHRLATLGPRQAKNYGNP